MATCEKLRVSPSQLRGRPTVTTYLYDDAGRLSRVVTASPWTAEDRVLILAWRQYKAGLCPGCGHEKAKAWHHKAGPGDYESEGDFVCQACTAAREPDDNGRVEPVTYPAIVDVHDHARDPYPGPPEPQI